jgi:hypothetical protein
MRAHSPPEEVELLTRHENTNLHAHEYSLGIAGYNYVANKDYIKKPCIQQEHICSVEYKNKSNQHESFKT